MDHSKAFVLGQAFKLGLLLSRCNLAQDSEKWITIGTKNNDGKRTSGKHVLIDGNTGKILGGLGGKFNGRKINQIHKEATRNSQKSTKGLSKSIKNGGIDLTLPQKIDKSHILQNRDRSTVGSVQQIHSIAQNPDYGRMSISRDFGSGAPVVAYGTYPSKTLGRTSYAITPDGKRYKVQYAVVSADDVLTSNNAQGVKNPDYYSDNAAKKRAIAGNGRMTAMREAYARGTAENYKQELLDDDMHGVDPNVIKKIKNPVLVRVMQPQDVSSDIGDKSNIQGGLQMSAVEQANNDKHRVKFDEIEVYSDGTPTKQSVKNFVMQMPVSERGNLIDTNGQPTSQALERMNNAIFAKAYNDDHLLEQAAQAWDPESKTIVNSLIKAAPKIQRLEGLSDGYDVRDIVSKAAQRAIKALSEGQTLADAASQTDLFEKGQDDEATRAVLKMFAENRSSKAISDKLNVLADKLYEEATKPKFDLFGAVESTPRNYIVSKALAQDRKTPKMSIKYRAFWEAYGGKCLKGIFNGNLKQDNFFNKLSRL